MILGDAPPASADSLRDPGALPRFDLVRLWVFRDAVFQDVGFENHIFKPSPYSALGVKSPHLH